MRVTVCVTAALAGALTLVAAHAPAAADEQRVFQRLGPIEVLGDGPHYVEVGVGAFDVFGRDEPRRSAVGRLELRIGEKVYFVGLAIGLMANTDGGVYGYGGFYADLVYGDFVLTPFLGFGGYREGGSKDLGGVFQFRSGGTLAYAFPDGSRLGIHVGHLSNAYIHEDNDGEEDIMLTYGFAF